MPLVIKAFSTNRFLILPRITLQDSREPSLSYLLDITKSATSTRLRQRFDRWKLCSENDTFPKLEIDEHHELFTERKRSRHTANDDCGN